MNPRMLCKKLFNFFTTVDRTPIPQQDHGVPDMFKQLFKEITNIQTVKIPLPKSEVERQAFPFGRYHQGIDGGNPVLLVKVIENWGLSFRSPGATNVWDEQEARFIDEDQTGPKFFGFFFIRGHR